MFICRYCDEEFSSQKELKKHEKSCDCNPSNFNVGVFKCRYCHQTFFSKEDLKHHKCNRSSSREEEFDYDD